MSFPVIQKRDQMSHQELAPCVVIQVPPDTTTVEPDPFLSSQRLFSDTLIRHNFLRKVFGIVSSQMILTIVIICLINFIPSIKDFLLTNTWIIWLTMVIAFILMIILGCYESVVRSYPLNIILLFIFSLVCSVFFVYLFFFLLLFPLYM